MAIVRWDPFRDFGFTTPSNTWMPAVDIYQTGRRVESGEPGRAGGFDPSAVPALPALPARVLTSS